MSSILAMDLIGGERLANLMLEQQWGVSLEPVGKVSGSTLGLKNCVGPIFRADEHVGSTAYHVFMTVPAEVLDAVLGLPDDVQDELVHELAARRQGSSPAAPGWDAEISNRVGDIMNGRVETIPLSEIKAELAARRAARGA